RRTGRPQPSRPREPSRTASGGRLLGLENLFDEEASGGGEAIAGGTLPGLPDPPRAFAAPRPRQPAPSCPVPARPLAERLEGQRRRRRGGEQPQPGQLEAGSRRRVVPGKESLDCVIQPPRRKPPPLAD